MTHPAAPAPADGPADVESLLDALAVTRRDRAALDAREAALLAAAVDLTHTQDAVPGPSDVRDIPLRSLAAQIGAMWRASDRTVQRQLSDAFVLVGSFPATHAALEAGEISLGHVSVIVGAGLPITDDEARALYEAAVLDVARRETPGRLKPAARMLANRLHPVPLETRHQAAVAVRNVWVRDLDDGMAELIATLPAPLAHGIRDRLDQYARHEIAARTAAGAPNESDRPDGTDIDTDTDTDTLDLTGAGSGSGSGGGRGGTGTGICSSGSSGGGAITGTPRTPDTRTVGQIRTDVFTDLLLTGHATPEVSNGSIPESEAIVAHVQVTVPVMTALGHDTTPAELTGHAPIDTATALRLAGTASGWDRVLTHPVTGTVVAVDRYRPTDHLKRVLRVRDEHCRFPGCRIPTRRCDIDHTIAREHDGPTEVTNLAHLCRRHHTLKHHSAWRVRQTDDGVLHWTSPTGRRYPDLPARTLTFTTGSSEPGPPAPF
jgi:hypothetical protein